MRFQYAKLYWRCSKEKPAQHYFLLLYWHRAAELTTRALAHVFRLCLDYDAQQGKAKRGARAQRPRGPEIWFCAAARRKCLKWCSEGQLQPRNHQNFENQVLTHIVKGTPHPIAQIKIWMSSCEAYVKIWDAFETLFSFLVPLSSRFTKKSKKRIQTRWGSELPEGRY